VSPPKVWLIAALIVVGAFAFAVFMATRPEPPTLGGQANALGRDHGGVETSTDTGYRSQFIVCRDGHSGMVDY
jgi:hypothetical protein